MGDLARDPYITHFCFECGNMQGIILIKFRCPIACPLGNPSSPFFARGAETGAAPGKSQKKNLAVSFNLWGHWTAYYATNSGIAENHFILMVKTSQEAELSGAGVQFSKTKHTHEFTSVFPGQGRGTPPLHWSIVYTRPFASDFLNKEAAETAPCVWPVST